MSSVKSVLRGLGSLPTTYDITASEILGQIGLDIVSSPLDDLLSALNGDYFDTSLLSGGGCGSDLFLI